MQKNKHPGPGSKLIHCCDSCAISLYLPFYNKFKIKIWISTMNKSLTTFLLTTCFFLLAPHNTMSADFPGAPEAISKQLREIGAVIDGRRTAAIYAPLFSEENYSDKTI
jgi:hypothetical protein